MRPVQLADIEMAARVLMCRAPDARAVAMQKMISQAVAAEQFRQTEGKPHPAWGTGTLMSSAAQRTTAPRPSALCADALHAYAIVIQALLAHATYQTS